jgi:hypothetical protein
MPIDVKLVLPPNLNNVFLSNDFVLNDGENYFTGKLNLSPNYYIGEIASIASNTSLTLSSNAESTLTSSIYFSQNLKTGTITSSTGSTTVTGSGTLFLSELKVGDKLYYKSIVTGNKTTLKFGLNLLDTDLREPVDLKTIKTLQLSNDPEFSTNSTITITDWPYDSTAYDPLVNNKVTGTNRDFIFTIDPMSFTDPDAISLGARTVDDTGSDLFIIENWPLSANGGLSTVYFKIVAEATDGTQGTYPNAAAIFDQIYWQPESGIKPGVPKVITRSEGYTGKKTLFRFESAQEGASNLYDTGVSRYSGDVIEHRPLPDTDAVYEYQFSSNRTTSIYRTIFPSVTPLIAASSFRRWDFDVATRGFVAATPNSLAGNTTEGDNLLAGNGLRINTLNTYWTYPTIKAPDFFAQAHVSIELTNDAGEYSFTLGLCNPDILSSTTPSETRQVEVKINVSNDSFGFMPQAQIISRASGVGTVLQTTTISRKIIKDLKDGGNVEIFISKLKRPSAVATPNAYDQKFLVRAYFTADSDQNRSYLLGSATVSSLTTFDYTNGTTQGKVIGFVLYECISGEINYTFEELAHGTGRILLDVDLGDCKTDDIIIDSSVTTNTAYDGWATALSNGTWIEFNENDPTPGSGSDPDGYYFEADVPATVVENRSYAEINAAMPSFSDRTKINFDLKIVQGHFYVALSPNPCLTDGITPDHPMGTRCDNSNDNSSEYLNKPTLMILFDQLRKNISLVHRKTDNSLETKILAPYENTAASDLTGTVTWDNTDELDGTDTEFLTEVQVGDLLYDSSTGVFIGKVKQIKSDLLLILSEVNVSAGTGITITKYKSIYSENIELIISNSPTYADGLWITIKKNGELLTSYKQAGDLPSARMGMGWHVAMGTRSNLPIDFGAETGAPTLANSRAYVGNVQIVGLPPKINIEETDLVNQRHFLKSIGGSTYQKPLLGQLMLAGNSEFRDFAYKSSHSLLEYRYFVQEFTPVSRTTGETTLYPHLLELLVEDTRRDNTTGDFLDGPKVKIFNYTSPTTTSNTSYIGTGVTGWLDGELQTLTTIAQSGFNVPNNSLIQFDISSAFSSSSLTSNTKYYLVIKVPKGINIARAKGFDQLSKEVFVDNTNTALSEGIPAGNLQGTGWQIVPWVWYKLFHGFRERYDNVYHNASLQMRVLAESHALVSSDASGLSQPVIVDREGPVATNAEVSFFSFSAFSMGSGTRPAVSTVLQPGVRTTVLNINADDALSGNWLFRVAKETDFGTVLYSEWLDWDAFKKRDISGNLIDDEVLYSVYHYGSWSKTVTGQDDTYTNSMSYDPQNLGTDGPRKIWVETMDKVGNISQSYPVTVNAQLLSVVDTVPPIADVDVIAADGISIDYTNQSEVTVQINASDVITSVKDVRFRLIDGNGVTEFSPWYPFSDVIKRPIIRNSNSMFAALGAGGSGLNTGDETTPPPDSSGSGSAGSSSGSSTSGSTGGTGGSGTVTTFTDLPGTKRVEVQVRDYGNNAKQPVGIWNTLYKNSYLSRNTFSAFGVTEFDRNILFIDAVTWLDPNNNVESAYLSAIKFYEFIPSELTFDPVTSWTEDNENAYEIKSTATGLYGRKIYLGANDTITLVINGVEYNKAASASDESVSAPKFYIDSSKGYLVVLNLPASTPTSLFECTINRSEAQLWRWNSNSFEKIANLGPLGERAILCMLPLRNRILLGSGNGKLWSYDGLNVSGSIFETLDLDGNQIPITAILLHQFMHETKSYVYLGTANKSYLFRAPIDTFLTVASWERLNLEPLNDKSYNVTSLTSAYDALFVATNSGKVFKYNRKLNKTNGTIITETTTTLNLNKSEIDVYESSILPVSQINSFANQVVAAIGDRPEVHSYTETLRPIPGLNGEVIADHDFSFLKLTDVKYATAAALTGTWTSTNSTLTRTTTGALTIDGSSVLLNERVLIKNQTNSKHNGIYIVSRVGSGSTTSILTRAIDFSYNSKIKGNTFVNVLSGSTNTNATFYLNTDDYIEVGIDNNTWSSTKTSFAHFYSTWTTTQFGKAFVQDPAGWGFQFYYNGDTNSRNKPEIVDSKIIDDKFSESGYKEVISLTGLANESTVFTTEDGSDWEQAVNRKPTEKEPFCVDFELRHSSGTGMQGFEIADGYHILSLRFNTSSLTISSGTSSVTKNFYNRDNVFSPYSLVEQKFPQIGAIQTWNFALESLNEDTNPVAPDGFGNADEQNWIAKKFASVDAKADVGNQNIIDATLATTANLSASYFNGANAGSPGIGAYLEFNAVGAQTIDSVTLTEGINLTETEYSVQYSDTNEIYLSSPWITDENVAKSFVGLTLFAGSRYLGTVVSYKKDVTNRYSTYYLDRAVIRRPSEKIAGFTNATLYYGQPLYVLVKDQTNKKANGLYQVISKGYTDLKARFVRASIFDEKSEMAKNTVVVIGSNASVNGTINNSKIFYFYTQDESIIIGETFINWYNATATTEVGQDHYLEVTSILEGGIKGDPIIGVENFDPIIADTNTYLLVRLKFSDVVDENHDEIADYDDTVDVATVSNITLSGTQTIDSVAVGIGDKVLVKAQNDSKQNGVYVVASGAWSRALNEYANSELYLTNSSRIKAINSGKIWYMHYDGVLKIGITEISYNTTVFNPTLKMRTYWSSVGEITNFEDYEFNTTFMSIKNNYDTYLIKPAWIGPVRSLYFEFEDFSKYQFNIKPKIEIDYVSIMTNAGSFDITKEFTNVRVALSGTDRTDVRVWVGKYEDPLIEQDSFATQESDKTYIRFGKLTPDTTSSSWYWGSYKYHVGHVIPPVFAEKQGFYPSFRFPSAGGVRKLIKHAGSAWCLSDGYYEAKTTDNPDDSIFKAWSYIPDKQIWKLESPSASRINSTKGLIRALAAVSYRDTLLVSGQIGTITNQNSLPSE